MAHATMKAEESHSLPSSCWRLRKAGSVVGRQASLWCRLQSRSEDLRARITKGRRRSVFQVRGGKAFNLPLLSGSIQVLNRLEDTHPHWGGPPALLSPPIQVLISFRNILIDTPRNSVSPALWTSCGPVKVTQTIKLHTFLFHR